MSELRYDPIRRIWVIIAGERGKRPSDFTVNVSLRDSESCPFCPGKETETPPSISEKSDATGNWNYRLVPNRFPVLTADPQSVSGDSRFCESHEGRGEHEVLIECRDHNQRWSNLSVEHIAELLDVYRKRIHVHVENGFPYVAIFRNVGFRGGATLSHPHSQLLAMPVIPPALKTELDSATEYLEQNKSCVFCDLFSSELNSGERIVFQSDDFVVLTPFASRFAYEMLILPRTHLSDFSKLSDSEILSAATILKSVMSAMDTALNSPDYNLVLHTIPNVENERFHWHFELLPRLAFQAGFEWGTAIHIVGVSPEKAAKTISASWK